MSEEQKNSQEQKTTPESENENQGESASLNDEESGKEEESVNQEDLAAQWEAQTNEQEKDENADQEDLAAQWEAQTNSEKSSIDESLPSFENYEKSENSKLSMLMDIPLEVTVEIGSAKIPIEEVLKLNPNSVVELDKLISEPVDLKVNGKLIAKGELYKVKNSFGIKITDIITPEDRMKILDEE